MDTIPRKLACATWGSLQIEELSYEAVCSKKAPGQNDSHSPCDPIYSLLLVFLPEVKATDEDVYFWEYWACATELSENIF